MTPNIFTKRFMFVHFSTKGTWGLTIFLTAIPVNAWGNEGHKAVGQIAQNILKPNIANKVANLFQDKSFGGQLPLATLWADIIKHKKGSPYSFWSSPLHYTNVLEPHRCCSNEENESPEGMDIVNAIANYTTQLDCESGYDKYTRDIALRFLAHFLGDITQPLHVCGRARGGNSVAVTFDGRRANLHGIWDTEMVEKRLEDFDSDYVTYARFLTNQIQNGTYASEKNNWIGCDILSPGTTNDCSDIWATDSKEINCYVWNQRPNTDLGKGYYNGAVPIIDKQLAKGGYRLGTLLNLILGKNC